MGKTLRRVDRQTKASERDAFVEHHGSDRYMGDVDEVLDVPETVWFDRMAQDPLWLQEHNRRALDLDLNHHPVEAVVDEVEVRWI